MKRRTLAAAAISATAAVAAAWWWTDSAPYPYAQRGLLDIPLPFLTNRRLDAVLGARPGERVLEIGPGTGLQALHVARALGEAGRLDIVDVQDAMLDCVMRRASAQSITSISPVRADARDLPFPDASFDAAYLVTVLGEIPEPGAAGRGRARTAARPQIVRSARRRRVLRPALRARRGPVPVRQRGWVPAVRTLAAAAGVFRAASAMRDDVDTIKMTHIID